MHSHRRSRSPVTRVGISSATRRRLTMCRRSYKILSDLKYPETPSRDASKTTTGHTFTDLYKRVTVHKCVAMGFLEHHVTVRQEH